MSPRRIVKLLTGVGLVLLLGLAGCASDGSSQATPTGVLPGAEAGPVMYEFYTDT